MSAGVSLDELARFGASSFLQTVLVIDNELEMTPPPVVPAAPKLQTPPQPGFGRRRSDVAAQTPAEPPLAAPEQAPEAVMPQPEHASGTDASRLDAKTIMDAFLKQSLICGMHKPEGRNDLVGEAIKAARRSDAVIVDWLLVGSDPEPAKDIITGILLGDGEDHGRLRLIVVYTSDPRIEPITSEIMERVPTGALMNGGRGVLTGPNTRIVVLNKSGTPTATETVTVENLPGRIIAEFAKLSEGILSTFAVTAVAAVRRATHHVLAVFSSELDGAFLAHRCALKTPDDATEFALELLAGEFKGAISRSGDATKVLGAPPLMEWIERRAREGMVATDEVQIPVGVAKTFPELGENAVLSSASSQEWVPAPDGTKPKVKLGQKKLIPKTIGRLFHDSSSGFRDAHHRFARLAQFKNEPYGIRAPRSGWRPTLSLGTLLVAFDGAGRPIADRYLLCTQPRCDAVRIGRQRRFPFQTGKAVDHDAFNAVAVIPGMAGGSKEAVLLSIDMKPYDTEMIEFTATQDERVVAEEANGSFMFMDILANRYLWLGDFRDLTAQRTAGKVAARLHDVGFDEYEWLRLHAGEKPPKVSTSPTPVESSSALAAPSPDQPPLT